MGIERRDQRNSITKFDIEKGEEREGSRDSYFLEGKGGILLNFFSSPDTFLPRPHSIHKEGEGEGGRTEAAEEEATFSSPGGGRRRCENAKFFELCVTFSPSPLRLSQFHEKSLSFPAEDTKKK